MSEETRHHGDIDDLIFAALTAWRTARDACPDRSEVDRDGPCCERSDNRSPNGWCDPTYCPRADF